MRIISLLATIFSICFANAQDAAAIKHGRFSDPIIPIFKYQDLSLSKQPLKVEECTYVWDRKNRLWIKRQYLTYNFNKEGYLIDKTEIKTDTPKEIVVGSTIQNFTYNKQLPLKVESTHTTMFKKDKEIEGLAFVFGDQGLKALVLNKDTLTFKENLLSGKNNDVLYIENGNLLEITHTDKSVLGLPKVKKQVSFGENLAPAISFKLKSNTIDIYLPGESSFYWSYYTTNAQADYDMLKSELAKGLSYYKSLLMEPSFLNKQQPKGFNHLIFKNGKLSNWIAIYNKKASNYNSPAITVRKISYPDNTVEGSLEIDAEFAALAK